MRHSLRVRARARLLAVALCLAPTAVSADAVPKDAAASAASPSAAAPNDHVADLETAIKTLLANRALQDASIGIAILDVDTGHFLATSNEHLALNPASNAKLYTTAAALSILRPDHRFETSITAASEPKEGAVGSIALRGHGDPSLTTADLWAMAEELRAHGVRRVDGDIVVDQKFFDEETTPPGFEQQPDEWAPFRAPISAVAVDENTVTLSVRPQAVGSPAIAFFDPPGFVDVTGSITTADSGADAVILALTPNGGRLAAKLEGAVAADSRLVRYTRRVDDPQLLAGYALRDVLARSGIKVSGDVKLGALPHAGIPLVKHASEPLSKLVYALGKNSDNFYAEMIFKSLAGEAKARPAKSADGAQIVAKWLEANGAWDAGVVIKNGSGLFDNDRATAASFVALLRAAWRDPSIAPEYVAQLSIGGVDGTLQKRFRDRRAHRAIRAKTGTLRDAIALSGYVFGPPGKGPIAFSILMNHAPIAQGRAAIDTLVELLARRQWGPR